MEVKTMRSERKRRGETKPWWVLQIYKAPLSLFLWGWLAWMANMFWISLEIFKIAKHWPNWLEERCQRLPRDSIDFTKIWNNFALFWAAGPCAPCVLHIALCALYASCLCIHSMAGWLCMRRVRWVRHTPIYVHRASKITSKLTQTLTNLTLPPSVMSFQVFNGTMACFGPQYVFIGLRETGLIFSSLKTHFLMFFFLHFFIDL